MLKIAFTIFAIILGNLLAFLTLGHILDAFFETEAKWKIICLVLSVLPLCVLLFRAQKRFQEQLELLHSTEEKSNGRDEDSK